MAKARKAKRKTANKRIEHFAEEVGAAGERIGKRMEREYADNWFHRTFGLAGPLISSVLGLLFFGLLIWLIGFLNNVIASPLLGIIQSFLSNNIGLFFMMFIFFSYTSYFSRHSPRGYAPFSPLVAAVGIAIGFWLSQNALSITAAYTGVAGLSTAAAVLQSLTYPIFLLALIIGYLVLVAKISTNRPLYRETRRVAMRSNPSRRGGPRRLYRSGNDRILGGVCGGIGEYFDIDPVIVRLLFVALAFAGGAGIILYILAWIIIPRNPHHRWNR